jgi:hypothetical protein
MTEVIYLSEAFTLTIKRQAFELTLRLDACIYLDSFPSNARRPHKSPAHTVKDQSLATDFSIRPQDLSSRVSRPFYISLRFRQHPKTEKSSGFWREPSSKGCSSEGLKS